MRERSSRVDLGRLTNEREQIAWTADGTSLIGPPSSPATYHSAWAASSPTGRCSHRFG